MNRFHLFIALSLAPLCGLMSCSPVRTHTPAPATKAELRANAKECSDLIEELESLSDDPDGETLKTIERLKEQRDVYLKEAKTSRP